MSPDDRWRVRHMIEAAEQAMAFIQGRDRADLDADAMLRFALVRAIEVVGEAATKVSDAGRSEMAAVPWPQIVGMRNRLVHAYFSIDCDVLWNTVQIALPALLAQLKAPPGSGQDQGN